MGSPGSGSSQAIDQPRKRRTLDDLKCYVNKVKDKQKNRASIREKSRMTMAKKIRQLRQDSIISSIKDGLPRGDSLALNRRKSEQMRVYEKWLQEAFWPQALRGAVAFLIVVFVLVLLMPTKQVAKKHQTKKVTKPPTPE